MNHYKKTIFKVTKSKYFSFIGIAFLTIIFRLPVLQRGLWNDELISINTLANNFLINPFYVGFTTNLPLYFIILKIFTINGIFVSEIYLRIISTIIFLILLFYLNVKIKELKIKLILFFLLILTPLQVHYSTEIRPYALAQTVIGIHLFNFLELVNKNKLLQSKKLYVLTLLLLVTHYSCYLYLGGIFSYLLIFKIQNFRKYIKYLLITTTVAIVVVFLSFVLNQPLQDLQNNKINYSLNIANIINQSIKIKEVVSFYYFYGLWYYLVPPLIQSLFKKLILILLVGVGISFFYKFKNNSLDNNIILITYLTLFTIIFSALLEILGLYPFGGRHIMPYSVLYYFVLSFSISNLKTKYFIIAGILIVSIFSLLFAFHNSCTITAINTKETKIEHEDTYKYCLDIIKKY